MEEIDDKRLYVTNGGGEEFVNARVLPCSIKIQSFGRSFMALLVAFLSRDGSDQSAHLRNLIRLFFFHISFETDVDT